MPVDVLACQFSATEWLVLLTPVPDNVMAGAVLVALLTTVTVPLSVPVVFGANTMFMIALCPGARVAPLMPLATLYAAEDPLMLIPEIVTFDVPLFVSVTGNVVLSPTVSLPKLKLDVDDTKLLVAVEPFPPSDTVTSAAPALFFSVRLAKKAPTAVGWNPTAK